MFEYDDVELVFGKLSVKIIRLVSGLEVLATQLIRYLY